ncbi:MAG: NAD(P)H-dependent glycerol-3-phosphate dehydrogenase [Planctomycetota bacterium]
MPATLPDPAQPMDLSVLGAGAWGIVLGSHLARKGHRVTAWDAAPQVIESLRALRGHPKLKGFVVPNEVRLVTSLAEALDSPRPSCLVVAVPSHAMRTLAEEVRRLDPADSPAPWVLCSKGIEEETLLTMTAVVESVRGVEWRERLAVLSGPSFAAEVGTDKPTTVCAASANKALAGWAQTVFRTETFRVYTQDDALGVQLGGSLKNVIAIASGVCDGMKLGDNARAALITRGLAEMVRLGVAMGAKAETFAGLAGMGDLILTCAGEQSRNHQFGELLAQGRPASEALRQIGMVVEGARTVKSVRALAARHGVEMPISNAVYEMLYEDKHPANALRDLLRRDPRPERD